MVLEEWLECTTFSLTYVTFQVLFSHREIFSIFTAIGIQLLKQSLKTTDLFEESICAHKKKNAILRNDDMG